MLERAWLGLRTDGGHPLETEGERRLAETWAEHGWGRMDGERVRLTAEGWLLLDRLAVEMASARDEAPASRVPSLHR